MCLSIIKFIYVCCPSNLRFKRYHKKKVNFHSAEGSFFCNKFGVLGLQSREGGYLNAKQIEAVRRALRRV